MYDPKNLTKDRRIIFASEITNRHRKPTTNYRTKTNRTSSRHDMEDISGEELDDRSDYAVFNFTNEPMLVEKGWFLTPSVKFCQLMIRQLYQPEFNNESREIRLSTKNEIADTVVRNAYIKQKWPVTDLYDTDNMDTVLALVLTWATTNMCGMIRKHITIT